MERLLQTTVGDGNAYHDLTFLWFANPGIRPPDSGALYHEEMARAVGCTVREFIHIASGIRVVGEAFVQALVSEPPRPFTGAMMRWIVELSSHLAGFESRKEFVSNFSCWVSGADTTSLTDLLRREQQELQSFDKSKLREHALRALHEPTVVVEASPPTLESVMTLLSKGSGVALGAYLGFQAANEMPLLVFAAVPGGMLICGTAAGVAEALQLGLRERIIRWLTGPSSSQQKPSPSAAEQFSAQIQSAVRPQEN